MLLVDVVACALRLEAPLHGEAPLRVVLGLAGVPVPDEQDAGVGVVEEGEERGVPGVVHDSQGLQALPSSDGVSGPRWVSKTGWF